MEILRAHILLGELFGLRKTRATGTFVFFQSGTQVTALLQTRRSAITISIPRLNCAGQRRQDTSKGTCAAGEAPRGRTQKSQPEIKSTQNTRKEFQQR